MSRPENLLDLFQIDPAAAPPVETEKPEPAFAAQPVFVGFDDPGGPFEPDPARLDPKRASRDDSAERPPPQPGRTRTPILGPVLSLAAHFSPLLLLLTWSAAPSQAERPIPIQLVLEQPPPPSPPPRSMPPAPKPETKRPLGPLASEDIGGPAGKPDAPPAEEPPQPPLPRPPEPKLAALAPPPKMEPKLTSALPKPAPPDSASALPEPEPAPEPLDLPPPKPKQQAVARAPVNPPARRSTKFPGPAATRNEYLAYCEALIRQHSSLVPEALLAGRRGSTTLSLLVMGDGSIMRITVVQSSGYPDIDARVEQMVAAVRRFPPVPQWYQGSAMALMYHFAFPDRH